MIDLIVHPCSPWMGRTWKSPINVQIIIRMNILTGPANISCTFSCIFRKTNCIYSEYLWKSIGNLTNQRSVNKDRRQLVAIWNRGSDWPVVNNDTAAILYREENECATLKTSIAALCWLWRHRNVVCKQQLIVLIPRVRVIYRRLCAFKYHFFTVITPWFRVRII